MYGNNDPMVDPATGDVYGIVDYYIPIGPDSPYIKVSAIGCGGCSEFQQVFTCPYVDGKN